MFEDIAITNLITVNTHSFSKAIKKAFDGECSLVDTKTTEGSTGWVVGVDRQGLYLDVGNTIDPAGMACCTLQHLIADARIGPGIANNMGFECCQPALFICSQGVFHGQWVALGMETN